MSCKCKGKEQDKKTAENNQWAGQAATGSCCHPNEKNEFSNEWVSTNKVATEKNQNKSK